MMMKNVASKSNLALEEFGKKYGHTLHTSVNFITNSFNFRKFWSDLKKIIQIHKQLHTSNLN